jgi:hypothetical protein
MAVNDLWGVTNEHIEALGRDAGHIDLIGITTPCNDISLARRGGRGLSGETGSLMLKASQILDWCQRVFPNAFFYREQVRGTRESQTKIDGISGEGVTFTVNANMLSASNRDRQFYTNFSPIGAMPETSPTIQDVLNKVHRPGHKLKALAEKAGCFRQSAGTEGRELVLDKSNKKRRPFTMEEREVCLGFPKGYTAFTAKGAVERRIQEFRDGDFFAGDYEKFGFVSLKGCGDDGDGGGATAVSNTKRAGMLGKSIDLHVLGYVKSLCVRVFVAARAGVRQEFVCACICGVV